MEIRNFNYFGSQQVKADSKNTAANVTAQDFDIDFQAISKTPSEVNPAMDGSGHWWCHPTHDCTGDGCKIIISLAICA